MYSCDTHILSVGLYNMGHVNLNLCAQRVGDLKVGIMWQGYPIRMFSIYHKENLNLPIVETKILI